MKTYFASLFLILGCFFTNLDCQAGPYIGVLGGGSGVYDLKKSEADATLGYYLGAHIGYKFFRLLRLEEEIIYQQAKIHSFKRREIKFKSVKGHVDVWSLMTNVLLDLNCPFFITPYFGGGIGYAHANGHWSGHPSKDRKNFSYHRIVHIKHLIQRNEFAWQAIAGLKFFVCLGFEAGLEYRYFKIKDDMANHRLGLALTKFF